MEFAEVVRRRRMTRSFDGRPVAAPALERVIDTARRGPSAGFSQGLDLLVLVGPEQTQRYWEVSFPDPAGRARFRWPELFAAPVLILPLVSSEAYLARYREADKALTARTELADWPVPYWWVDGGMAVMLALLAAVDEGLGALFFGIFDEHLDAFRAAFGVPEELRPIGAMAVGHRAPDTPSPSLRRGRRAVEEVVHRGHW